MILQKTAKALDELQPGSRKLPQRARTVLLLADGKTLAQLHALLGGDHAAVAQTLVAQGYLQLENGSVVSPSAFSPTQQTTAQTPQPGAAAATLSMAGTRMYLFDLCERLFANRHEMLAQSLRAQLREARDLAALRCAGLALLQAVRPAVEIDAAYAAALREAKAAGVEVLAYGVRVTAEEIYVERRLDVLLGD